MNAGWPCAFPSSGCCSVFASRVGLRDSCLVNIELEVSDNIRDTSQEGHRMRLLMGMRRLTHTSQQSRAERLLGEESQHTDQLPLSPHKTHHTETSLLSFCQAQLLYGVDVTGSKFLGRPEVVKAAEFAAHAHAHQRRRTGEPYVTHCVATAKIVEGLMASSRIQEADER